MDVRAIVRQSRSYRLLRRVGEYASNSTVYRLLGDSRYISAFVFVFVLVSVVRVLLSDMSDVVKFLSFAVMFLILAGLVRNVVRPSQFEPPAVEDGAGEDD